MTTPLGTVAELRRFPVKSMRGEMPVEVELTSAGVAGDRLCALIDRQTAKVASAKLPHRWRGLLEFGATIRDRPHAPGPPVIDIQLPDGTHVASDSSDVDAILSAAIGRAVQLIFARPPGLEMERARPDEVAERGSEQEVSHDTLPVGMAAPEGGFVDFAPLHVITTASLSRVAVAASADTGEAERFRPNIVIANDGAAAFVENGWVGGIMEIGASVAVRVILPTPRCAVPTLAHGRHPASPKLTQIIAGLNRVPVLDLGELACLGAYAEILRPGPVRIGDAVRWRPE